MLGTTISTDSQITNIEKDGFWMLIAGKEFFVSFDRYPAFRGATIAQIFHFEQNGEDLYWPDLDIDIEMDALRHPERFPLIFK